MGSTGLGVADVSSADDERIDSTRSTLVGFARSAAIRYSIILPKIKAANFFQPEDHIKNENISRSQKSLFGARFLGIAHTASIFGAGTVLFVLQEKALKRLEPETNGDFSRASPQVAAIAGGCGGFGYALCATLTHTWLGSQSRQRCWWLDSRSFLRRALPYTVPRDVGGFAVYFGVYAYSHRGLNDLLRARVQPSAPFTPAVMPTPPAVSAAERTPAPKDRMSVDASDAPSQHAPISFLGATSTAELAAALATIALSGALSGLCTYLWRTPFDTMYKQSVGWRDESAPLWSLRRFLRSPRGAKAVAVGAATWSVYEVADASLRYLAASASDL